MVLKGNISVVERKSARDISGRSSMSKFCDFIQVHSLHFFAFNFWDAFMSWRQYYDLTIYGFFNIFGHLMVFASDCTISCSMTYQSRTLVTLQLSCFLTSSSSTGHRYGLIGNWNSDKCVNWTLTNATQGCKICWPILRSLTWRSSCGKKIVCSCHWLVELFSNWQSAYKCFSLGVRFITFTIIIIFSSKTFFHFCRSIQTLVRHLRTTYLLCVPGDSRDEDQSQGACASVVSDCPDIYFYLPFSSSHLRSSGIPLVCL